MRFETSWNLSVILNVRSSVIMIPFLSALRFLRRSGPGSVGYTLSRVLSDNHSLIFNERQIYVALPRPLNEGSDLLLISRSSYL